ncbi:hypothetical protein ACFWAZ_32570 [Streptomyces collinus]
MAGLAAGAALVQPVGHRPVLTLGVTLLATAAALCAPSARAEAVPHR